MKQIRKLFIRAALIAGLLLFGTEAVTAEEAVLGETIQVPLSYGNSESGFGSIYFELGAPYDKSKPVVIIVTDAQQFYVRRGTVADLQAKLFGTEFNVIGIAGRGACEKCIEASLDANGQPDWMKAWEIFRSEQWIEDIEMVRKRFVGENGKILLYGGSGGAYLIHQYLTKYGKNVQRAFTASPDNPFIANRIGISPDPFWNQIGAHDRNLQSMLQGVLKRRPAERLEILLTLQRQHFFVPADMIATARADLISVLANDDAQQYERAKKEYQVKEILELFNSSAGIPVCVREFEFLYPTGAFQNSSSGQIRPYIDSQYIFLKQLVTLADSGKLTIHPYNFSGAHRLDAEVFVLAARWDEAIDYRISLALAFIYPHQTLFIANDNHTFESLKRTGDYISLLRAFFKSGLGSAELQTALKKADRLQWRER